MTLAPGRRIGPYQVTAPLGSEGMGVVWRAHDTRLGRDVALKTLPQDFEGNPDRVARLTREARLLASLSHPHIAAVHGLEESEGQHVLVLELVEGRTLAERLAHGRLPLDEALSIARQVAEALEAAHEKGIVHRDLKPANVALSPESGVKLLDFGLATALSSEPGDVWEVPADAPTASVSETAVGVVLGTARYMSPEQAQGKPVDKRADVWAFGVVLFEMLSGRRLFAGETVPEILGSVLRQEVDVSLLPAEVPSFVRILLERCLVRDPRERLRDIGEARIALGERNLQAAARVEPTAHPRAVRPLRQRTVPALLGVLLGLALSVPLLRLAGGFRGHERPAGRFELGLPPGRRLLTLGHALDISPDGKQIVFAATTSDPSFLAPGAARLFIQKTDSYEATEVPGSEGWRSPVFSPDGRWIAFIARANVPGESSSQVRKVQVTGGTPITLAPRATSFGFAWAGDGSIVFADWKGSLMRVAEPGGKPEPVTALDQKEGEWSHRLPHFLPDGQTMIYTAVLGAAPRWETSRIYAQRLGAKGRSLLVEGGSDGRWAPPGVLLFAREGSLFAARLSRSGLALAGPPVRLVEGVRHSVFANSIPFYSGAAQVAVAGDGRLVYAPGPVDPEPQRSLVWVDEKGRETPIDAPLQSYLSMKVSPDGKRLLLTHAYERRQVEVFDLARGTTQLVTVEGMHRSALWGPGDGEVTFDTTKDGVSGIYRHRLDAPPGEGSALAKAKGAAHALGTWSPDGKRLAFTQVSSDAKLDVMVLTPGQSHTPLVATSFDECYPEISPDGRWLAYAARESDRLEVFVRPFDRAGERQTVSVAGGTEPLWARDGRALFFKKVGGKRDSVEVDRVRVTEKGGRLELGQPERLFEGPYGTGMYVRNWDVAPDGRFLLDRPAAQEATKAYWDTISPTRLRIDLGGIPGLLAAIEKPN